MVLADTGDSIATGGGAEGEMFYLYIVNAANRNSKLRIHAPSELKVHTKHMRTQVKHSNRDKVKRCKIFRLPYHNSNTSKL